MLSRISCPPVDSARFRIKGRVCYEENMAAGTLFRMLVGIVMPRAKSSKIFVKSGPDVRALMWATVGNDGSVMMGFPWGSTESVELVMDREVGNLSKAEIFSTEYAGTSKINFHASGSYKLSCSMGRNAASVDRVTVRGVPLAEISEPRRMVEILLPTQIPKSGHTPSETDVVLDIAGSDSLPTRCTVGCVSNSEFEKVRSNEGPMVDTSEWEAWNALASESHTWIWVLRKSRNDVLSPSKFYVTLLGDPKWAAQ